MSSFDAPKPWCLTHDRPRYFTRSRRCWMRMQGHSLPCRWQTMNSDQIDAWRRSINPPNTRKDNLHAG